MLAAKCEINIRVQVEYQVERVIVWYSKVRRYLIHRKASSSMNLILPFRLCLLGPAQIYDLNKFLDGMPIGRSDEIEAKLQVEGIPPSNPLKVTDISMAFLLTMLVISDPFPRPRTTLALILSRIFNHSIRLIIPNSGSKPGEA
jgi:hypothetical protein